MSGDGGHQATEARLCRLRLWPDSVGYGFSIQTEKSATSWLITRVDAQSPAQESGLRKDDRIVEVNGINVVDKSLPEVKTLLRSRQGEVDMLVVDSAADDHFRSHGVRVHGSMTGVVTITCPARNPHAAGEKFDSK